MSQIRCIGYNEAISQEVIQLISRAAVPAGVVLGFETSVEDAKLSGVVNIRIKPGLLSMSDGMLVAESDDLLVPLSLSSSDSGLQYTLTLIAEKGTGYGKLDDPVTYKVLPGRFYASQLPQIVGRLRMPLAFITKAPTGLSALSFTTTDLGDRSVLNRTLTLDAPITSLRTLNGAVPETKMDLSLPGFVQSLAASNLDNQVRYYLPLNLDANHQLLAVTLLGRSNLTSGVTQKVHVTSLKNSSLLSAVLQFHGSNFIPQTVIYPAVSPVLRDVLEIEVRNYDPLGNVSTSISTAFELQQVVIATRRIFA